MLKNNALWSVLFRSPLLWGTAVSFFFFALIHGGVVSDPTVIRYLAGHWVEYVETWMFGIGLAALVIKAGEIMWQRRTVSEATLPPIPDGGQDPMEAVDLVKGLPDPEPRGETLIVRRLREALDLVVRTGTADDLEDHLKYLSDLDAARAAQGYGLVRFVIWAIPIMGFLGTVIGITVAIACLSPTQLENISGVVAGLGTAFDTTATALGLSMVLMFGQFLVDRSEQRLLTEVDATAWESLAGRFQSVAGSDGASLAIARLGEAVTRNSEKLIEAQAQSWRSLEQSASTALSGVLDAAGDRLQAAIEQSIQAALESWTESLANAQENLSARREDRWAAAAQSLASAMQAMERHEQTLAGQTKLLAGVVDATRDLTHLEKTLNDSLATLSATGRFDEVLTTLSAATQLLAARVGATPRAVEPPRTSQFASQFASHLASHLATHLASQQSGQPASQPAGHAAGPQAASLHGKAA